MVAVLVFSITLILAVFFSKLARRSVLSTAVVFLIAGFFAGGIMKWMPVTPSNPVLADFSKFALFSVLFTDGMMIGVRDLISAWHLPGRALLFGFPLNLALVGVLAHWIVELPWIESLFLGTVLSPTDPVFAAATVGRKEIPDRIRHLLNVESGVNDGLALPIVLFLLSAAEGTSVSGGFLAGEVVLGAALGVTVPWVVLRLERLHFFALAPSYEAFDAFAVALLLLSLATLIHGNPYLAAFLGGMTIASAYPDVRERFHAFGERLSELLKLAALLIFGALISPAFLASISWAGYLFAVLVLMIVRPVALSIALLGSRLDWREWFTIAWFGPRGFASVVFGLLVLQSEIANSFEIFHLIALVVTLSILAHSSSDVPMAHKLYPPPEKAEA